MNGRVLVSFEPNGNLKFRAEADWMLSVVW